MDTTKHYGNLDILFEFLGCIDKVKMETITPMGEDSIFQIKESFFQNRVTLHFSNHLEELARRLADLMSAHSQHSGVSFSPNEVLVPNMNLTLWLQMELARINGVEFNVTYSFLESGLWSSIQRLLQLPSRCKNLNKHRRRLLLSSILQENEEIEFYQGYLTSGDSESTLRESRAWDLAGAMAQVFEDYEYHRLEMVENWRANPNLSFTDEEEASSYKLYQACLESSTKFELYSLFDLNERLSKAEKLATESQPLYCFGFGQVSMLHMHTLERIAKQRPVHLLHLNPSAEYWEDANRSSRSTKARIFAYQFETEEEVETINYPYTELNPLLEHWGKPGVESVQMLCTLTNYNFENLFHSPQQDTLLASLQRIMLQSSEPDYCPDLLKNENSLNVFSAPSRKRELEFIYDQISHDLADNPDLSPCDIAVLIPNLESYRTAILDVFERDLQLEGEFKQPIPFNLVDVSASTDSHFAQAVLALFRVSQEGASRESMFSLLSNPCLMDSFQITQEELDVWLGWIQTLQIFEGLSESTTIHSWEMALKRLRLGLLLPQDHRVESILSLDRTELIPSSSLQGVDQPLLMKFSNVIASILSLAKELNSNQSQSKWRELLGKISHELLSIPEFLRGEGNVKSGFLRSLEVLELFEEKELSFTWIANYCKEILKGIHGGKGSFLADGVTIAALQPLRPIPFKHIYIPGLDEDSFPGKRLDSSLDLRKKTRLRGEFSTPERNRYLLLETLCSAREKLTLSYANRDLVKDREVNPSSVLFELISEIQRILSFGGKNLAYPCLEVPLHQAKTFEQSILLKPMGEYEVAIRKNPVSLNKKVIEPEEIESDLLPDEMEQSLELDLSTLERYIKNPLKVHAKMRHGLRDDSDSLESDFQEPGKPLSLNNLDKFLIFKEAINYALEDLLLHGQNGGLEAWHDFGSLGVERSLERIKEYFQYKQKLGELPPQDFADQSYAALEEPFKIALQSVAQTIEEHPVKVVEGVPKIYRAINVNESSLEIRNPELRPFVWNLNRDWSLTSAQGETAGQEGSADSANSLDADSRSMDTMHFSGSLDWIYIDQNNSLHNFCFLSSGEVKPKHLVRASLFLSFFDYFESDYSSYHLHSITKDPKKSKNYEMMAMDEATKEGFAEVLFRVVGALLRKETPVYIPLDLLIDGKILDKEFKAKVTEVNQAESVKQAWMAQILSSEDPGDYHNFSQGDLESLIIPGLDDVDAHDLVQAIQDHYFLGRYMVLGEKKRPRGKKKK